MIVNLRLAQPKTVLLVCIIICNDLRYTPHSIHINISKMITFSVINVVFVPEIYFCVIVIPRNSIGNTTTFSEDI